MNKDQEKVVYAVSVFIGTLIRYVVIAAVVFAACYGLYKFMS